MTCLLRLLQGTLGESAFRSGSNLRGSPCSGVLVSPRYPRSIRWMAFGIPRRAVSLMRESTCECSPAQIRDRARDLGQEFLRPAPAPSIRTPRRVLIQFIREPSARLRSQPSAPLPWLRPSYLQFPSASCMGAWSVGIGGLPVYKIFC